MSNKNPKPRRCETVGCQNRSYQGEYQCENCLYKKYFSVLHKPLSREELEEMETY